MLKTVSIILSGIQGEGFVSTGEILIKALSRCGYFCYGGRTFSSRIKGGSSSYSVDISSEKILCNSSNPNILVAFDQSSLILYKTFLIEGGILIYDDILQLDELSEKTNDPVIKIVKLPLTNMAKIHGSNIMKNTALVGILIKLLGIPLAFGEEAINSTFSKKGKDVVEKNLAILRDSYNYDPIELELPREYRLLPPIERKPLASMIGNEAIALGALMAGCRFMATYPITPASEIMEYLTKKFPKYNGILVQTEDEISAVTMSIGASYAGTRSITATSGPGISLMMEGIGLAAMVEVPLVIVDSQRGGPSTGLPTKTEQSDILSVCYGPHGEIPSIILTPYSVESCFYKTIEAFNLADYYQCPVFILSDLTLGLSRQTIENLDRDKISIDRGKISTANDLELSAENDFLRFYFTKDGISPRVFPGQEHGMHHVTGIEHKENGKPDETPVNRVKMMNKRLRKIVTLIEEDGIDLFEYGQNDLLILAMGSNYGVIKRTIEENSLKVNYGIFTRIKPLPIRQLKSLFHKYSNVLVVENNGTGQLASLIKSAIDQHSKITSLLKYDGTPFSTKEILKGIEELV